MYKCFEGHKPKIKTLLHVFDHTVKPILTYGSEVWGTCDPQKYLKLDLRFVMISKICLCQDDITIIKSVIYFY
jgi:hypothetical protein